MKKTSKNNLGILKQMPRNNARTCNLNHNPFYLLVATVQEPLNFETSTDCRVGFW
jgi:hypothetical protein